MLIEELPSGTTTTVTPGYAIVPDTRGLGLGEGVSVAAGGRKRAARSSAFGAAGAGRSEGFGQGGSLTARQQNAIAKHIADLDRDSPKDSQVQVPQKAKESNRPGKKMTTNVRRILTSQKTFANHLADEEAALALHSQPTPNSGTPTTPLDTARPDAALPVNLSAIVATEPDIDPLLRIYMPKVPSPATMKALTSATPLSYNAARASLGPDSKKPARHFCDICGYWGLAKCLRCGARVCGLDCKTTHDEGRCLKFYA